jgi:hypothetical protein
MKNKIQIPVVEFLGNSVKLNTELKLVVKEWFNKAATDPKKHPLLQGELGWNNFLLHYEWIGGKSGAREMKE